MNLLEEEIHYELLSSLEEEFERLTNVLEKKFDGEKDIYIQLSYKIDELRDSIKSIRVNAPEQKEIDLRPIVEEIKKVNIEVKAPEAKIIKSDNPYDLYKPADVKKGGGSSYYGYLAPDGRWFIMRVGGRINTSYRYASGKGNYVKAWEKKSSHDYKRYSEVKL